MDRHFKRHFPSPEENADNKDCVTTSAYIAKLSPLPRRQLLLPDPQILWQPGAQLALARRLKSRDRPDVVFITAPPFSQFLLAPMVRLARGTAVVLDYRDEWSTLRQSYEMVAGGLAKLTGEALERRLLRAAHAVTTSTEPFRQHLLSRFPFLRPEQVFAIPNGYDREDIPPLQSPPTSDRMGPCRME